MNTLKVGLLMAAITALLVMFGNILGGTGGMIIAFGIAIVMNFGAFWFSDKMVLKMTKAQAVTPQQAPDLHRMVDILSQRANIPKPAVYIVNDPSPNAFATGRSPKHSAVAVNTGLISLLSRDEVFGVVAHEIAHIKSRDTLTMAITSTMAGAITMLANIAQFALIFGGFGGGDDEGGMNPLGAIVMMIVGPLAAMMIQMAISRAREFEADKLGAQLAGTSNGLANALLKLEQGTAAIPTRTDAAHANMYIVNPLKSGGFQKLFMTHPPIEERVSKLKALKVDTPSDPIAQADY